LPGRAKESQNEPETGQSLFWSIPSRATFQYNSSILESKPTRFIFRVAETLITQILDYEKHICLSKHVLKEINNTSKTLKSKAVTTRKKPLIQISSEAK
jgi:hypothetical protein